MDKKKTRREFIEQGIKAGIALPLLGSSLYSCSSEVAPEESAGNEPENKSLKILILGGTSFLGPQQIAYALGRGHTVSTFTRGKTIPSIHQELFKQVEQLIGDRNDDLTALENRKWDVVIDNSGHRVEWTKQSAALLKDSCDLYLYTSSTGVYYPYLEPDLKEDKNLLLAVPTGVEGEEKMEYDYGVMKANSELAAIDEFGRDRTIIVRPTYMFGPGDKTDRFIHWPIRLSKGGEVIVPGKKEDPVQYMDVRDVAEWMIRLLEEKNTGTYNAVGPKEAQGVYAFVEEAKTAFSVENSLVLIDDYDFLKKNEIHYIVPWIMPIDKNANSARVNNHLAKENGLTFRPLAESIKDTHDWWYSDAVEQERRDKVEAAPASLLAREQAIIDQWKAR